MTENMDQIGVLLVDDSDNAIKLMTTVLMGLGIQRINSVNDGEHALKFLEHDFYSVDLIICDWNMPGMSGIELLKRVRTFAPRIPFIMVTGKADLESVIAAKNEGVNGYVTKPYSPKQVNDKIEAALNLIAT